MLIRRYEMPWRPAYEVWAALGWLSCLVFIVYFAGRGTVTMRAAMGVALLAILMAGHRFRQGFEDRNATPMAPGVSGPRP